MHQEMAEDPTSGSEGAGGLVRPVRKQSSFGRPDEVGTTRYAAACAGAGDGRGNRGRQRDRLGDFCDPRGDRR